MESSHGNEVIVPDTTSDSSMSPEKKRKKVVSNQQSRLLKSGKQKVSFRAASRISQIELNMDNSASYYKRHSKTSTKFHQASKSMSDLIIIDDAPVIQSVASSKQVGSVQPETRNKVLSLNTRTTLASFHDALLKLNPAQKDAVRDIGFGNILELRVKELPGRLAYWVLNSFNPKTCEIEISTSFRVKVTKDDVYRVFGIPKGFQRIKRFDRQTSNELFEEWVSLFRVENRDKIKIGLVVNEMLKCKTGGAWFKRHFMIAMCFSIFESISNGTVHPHILNTLGDVDKLVQWDWAEYMVRSLIENRDTWGGDETKMYTGPLIFLVLFYVDRINISGTITKRVFPILMNWSSSDLRERQRIEMTKQRFGIGRLRGPLTLPDRYGVKVKNPEKCEEQIGADDDYSISKKLREDAKFISDRMARLGILANSTSTKEKGSKFFRDSLGEVFKLTGVCIEITTPKKEKQPTVIMDLEDDITYPKEFYAWMDATSAEALSKPKIVDTNKLEIPSFDLCVADEEFVIPSEVPVSFETPPSSSKQGVVQVSYNGANIGNKENQDCCTPSKTAGYGNRLRSALCPLDENSSEPPSNVIGGESPIYGCVRKDFPVRKLHYRANNIDNVVCCTTPLSIREKAIAMYCLYSDFLAEGVVIFMFKDIELCRFDLVCLRIGAVVQPSIVNAWSTILNHFSTTGSSNKPTRFFASTDIYIDCISQTGMSYISRRSLFFEGMDRELRLYQTNALGSIDMFVFPIFADDRAYVLCIDLPKEVIFIIDTSVVVKKHPVGSNYKDLCSIMRSLLVEFLTNNNEPLSSASVSKSTVEVVDLNLSSSVDSKDVGLYVMRHMETFEGHQLRLLRVRYCATIVSWENNKYKDDILRESSATYEAELAENAPKFDGVLIW